MSSLAVRIIPLLASAGVAMAMAVPAANADELHIATANTSTNRLYEVFFGPSPPAGATALAATPISPNGGSSVRSLVYVSNEQTATVDLIAADTTGGKIVRYAGSTGTPQTLWAWPVAGPRGTDGLSVDAQGNLWVISSDAARNELWVLRRDPALPPGAGFLPPLLVDNSHFATTSKMRLVETLVVRSPIGNPDAGGLGSGDLLVQINDGRVLRYSAASLKAFLAGGGPIAPPQTLITAKQCPAGQTPTGMALWPTDGTLLVATIGGSVLRYTLTATGSSLQTSFATGLGVSLGKIKTFVNAGVPYAVFDQPIRGKISEFGAPPAGGCPNLKTVCNAPLVTVTSVALPYALATTDSSAPTQDCVFGDTNPDHSCTLLSGAEKLGVSSANPGATIVDVACVIDPDPRVDPLLFTCDGTSLPVATFCPGFGPTTIPGYMCGASGPSQRGLALIKSIEQNGFPVAPFDLLVKTELNADALLAPPNPGCPQLTLGWAPLTGEGTINEGNDMIELTSYCGSSRGLPPGHSLMGLGLQLNPNAFPGATLADKLTYFANQKFTNLSATIASAPNLISLPPDGNPKAALASCVAKAQGYLNDTVNLDAPTRYACAAHQAWVCDSTVSSGNFIDNANQLSNYSAIRGRLANLILTIDTRLAGHPASTSWPLADPGLPASSCDPDTTPPSTPVMMAPSNITKTSLQLNWHPSTDSGTGVGGYLVSRNGGSPSTVLASACNPDCSFADAGLTIETTYSYQVIAFDNAPAPGPNNSDPANSQAATSPDDTAPTTPSGLAPAQGSPTTTGVTLNWGASSDTGGTGVAGYYVYRNNVRITPSLVNGTTFTDSGLTPGTTYNYQVSAVDNSAAHNESPLSPGLPVTTLTPPDTTPPSVPTGLSKIYTGSKTLKITWGASTDPAPYATGVGGYNVFVNSTKVTTTTNTFATITLNTNTSDTKFNVTVSAFDKATPTPNTSAPSAPLVVTCYDPGHDHDCDRFP